MMAEELVLVSGASGYIATHIVQQLLQEGYRVRGTVRSLKNEAKIQPLKELCPDAKYPLELVEADLTDADSWQGAIKGCTYVLHVASPFPASDPQDENELIKPAVDGTLNVLKACKDNKTVKRVVVTSSVAAVSGGFLGGEKLFTEEDWTDTNNPNVAPYAKSKSLAEKAAWDFVNELSNEEKFELATINPSYVMGPVLCGSFTTSMEVPKRIMERAMPMLPHLNFSIVDVRDVAAAHIAAMKLPEAAGCRHITATENLWFKDIASNIKEEFSSQGYNVPTMVAPYPFLWLFARFDATIKMILPSIGRVTKFDNDRMVSVLGIKPRPVKDTIIDMCYSMVEAGKIKKTQEYKGPK